MIDTDDLLVMGVGLEEHNTFRELMQHLLLLLARNAFDFRLIAC